MRSWARLGLGYGLQHQLTYERRARGSEHAHNGVISHLPSDGAGEGQGSAEGASIPLDEAPAPLSEFLQGWEGHG